MSDNNDDDGLWSSPEKPTKKTSRQKSVGPPLRLAWPGSGLGGGKIGQAATLCSSSQQSNTSTAASTANKRVGFAPKHKKRKRRKDTTMDSNQSTMWVEKYTPWNDSSRLVVAPKKVTQAREWIQNALSGNKKVLILVGSPGIGKSTMIRVLAAEMKLTLQEWNDSYSNRSTATFDSLLSVDRVNALTSFQQFLSSAGVGYQALLPPNSIIHETKQSSKQTKKRHETFEGKSIILLEELPNLYSREAEAQFREIMDQHIEQSQVPTVLIFSNVCEGKHKPADLERLISEKHLYSDLVTIMQLHAVTRARMKKTLHAIAKAEHLCLDENSWEELYLQSGGDVRHAIMSLQFQKGGNYNNGTSLDEKDSKRQCRDTKLSTFHALGKLLYAKRQGKAGHKESNDNTTNNSILLEQRPPLEFNPELVMQQSDIGLGGALSFLAFHGPEFFTDITELSQAFGHFSDAAMFLDNSMNSQRDFGDTIYPNGYVSSLAGRAVANANRHAAPNKFRSFTAPKVFEVMRKRRGNDVTMKQLCKRLSFGSCTQTVSLDCNLGSTAGFVTNDLPFMRTILPQEVNHAVNNLYSFVKQEKDADKNASQEKQALLSAIQDQQQILEMDDIVEDDDSSVEEQKMQSSIQQDLDDNEWMEKKTTTNISPTSTIKEPAVAAILTRAVGQPDIIVIDEA